MGVILRNNPRRLGRLLFGALIVSLWGFWIHTRQYASSTAGSSSTGPSSEWTIPTIPWLGGSSHDDETISKSPWYLPLMEDKKASRQNDSHASPVLEQVGNYSIKPIVYVFPQFHAIPENDKIWGKGFVEWVNVKKVTVSQFDVPTIRPAREVGYYNLLDISTRKRWTKTINESQIYGIAYHHYWFGYPVMDKPLQAMLKDGHPDVPFMLSWANEPWTNRWDGKDAEGAEGTLLAQNYGTDVEDWRSHFDWMVPFFRHPNYIRVKGKVQLVIYNPGHIGDLGKEMFTAWRKWAAEDPSIGGMDVIETKLEDDDPDSRGPTDAMNEFGLRSGGGIDHTRWVSNPRPHRVFHRGGMVSWDNSPRHATDGRAFATIFANPKLWKFGMIELMRRIKTDPNPLGEENFLFINAFNEWGEGNTLEPSMQWGDGFLRALDSAKEYADKHIPWRADVRSQGLKLAKEMSSSDDLVDVCVIIREFDSRYPFEKPSALAQTIYSLQQMKNKRWRAVIAKALPAVLEERIDATLDEAYEPRIVHAEVPEEVVAVSEEVVDGVVVTDWVISRIDDISPSCGRARYMLITDASNTYEPETFDSAIAGREGGDIIGLNFVSRATLNHADTTGPSTIPWNQRCDRFENGKTSVCQPMAPEAAVQDLGAALINMTKWRAQRHELSASIHLYGSAANILRRLVEWREGGWTWTPPVADASVTCHYVHANSITDCVRSGRIWADVPEVEGWSPGCWSGVELADRYGDREITKRWDYKRFKRSPYCIRLSASHYKEVSALGRTE